jgi:uncharacterized protein (DUF952 family)
LTDYVPPSLAEVGFVHLCHREQAVFVLETHFGFGRDVHDRRAASDVRALVLDESRLLSPIKEEHVEGHGVFPHLYGPLRQDAVLTSVLIERDVPHNEVVRLIDDAIDGVVHTSRSL